MGYRTSLGWSMPVFAAILVFVAGCGTSNDESGWDVNEGAERPEPLQQGIYSAEFEIIEDGCAPSLESIFGKVDLWPPPQVPLFYREGPPETYNTWTFNAFSWRDGRFKHPQARADSNSVSLSTTLETLRWPSIGGFADGVGLECAPRLDDSALTEMIVTQTEDNAFDVRVRADWYDFDECVDERHYELYETLPESDCHEEYLTKYTLLEACPNPCQPESSGITGGVVDGYPRSVYSEQIRCECPE